MLKMLLDPMGGIVLTNDGNAILREVEVAHPAAKSMIELSRTQDEEVGDGTTSVIILGIIDAFDRDGCSGRGVGEFSGVFGTQHPSHRHHFRIQARPR
jgi:hypothetical protein